MESAANGYAAADRRATPAEGPHQGRHVRDQAEAREAAAEEASIATDIDAAQPAAAPKPRCVNAARPRASCARSRWSSRATSARSAARATATARSATFNTTDRCDGTLTEVGRQGHVSRSKVKGKTQADRRARPAAPTWSRRKLFAVRKGNGRIREGHRRQLSGPGNSARAARPAARTPSLDVLRARAQLLGGDLELERRRQRRARRASISRLARPTAIGAHASSSPTSSAVAASRSSARRGSRARSARPRPRRSSRPVMISSFARPTPTTCGRREEPPTSGTRPRRVSGSPTYASSDSTRRSQASASSSAPPRQTPWIAQTVGLVISSARFQASRQARRKVRRRSGAPAARGRARRRPCRRRTPGRCRAARRSARRGRRRRRAGRRRSASTSSSLNALRFSGRLRMTWRTASRSSVMTRSDTADEAIGWADELGGRPARAPAPAASPRAADRCRGGGARRRRRADGVPARATGCRRRPRGDPARRAARCCSGSARRRPNEDGKPPAYQSVLLATGLPLLYAGLLIAARVLGGLRRSAAGRRVAVDVGGGRRARAVAGVRAQQRDLAAARRDPRRRRADLGLVVDLRLDSRRRRTAG